MKFLKTFLISFFIHSCICEVLRCKNCSKKKNDLPVEQLLQLRYEYLKNQILKKLHLREAPKTNLPKPPIKSLLAIAKMAENETISEAEEQLKTENVVIYPQNDNFSCIENTHPCSRFEFVVPESLSLENFVSADVWFYETPSNIHVHQIVIDNSQNVTVGFELDHIVVEQNGEPWSKYSVSGDSIRSNNAYESILVLEVINDNQTAFRTVFDEKPFLVIRAETFFENSRKRRGISCGEKSSSCCKENFFLNFAEIGWDNWILHPDGYQANFCRGHCFNDLSNTRFYHSTVLLSYIRDNKDIAEEIGLNMCCTPSVMSPVGIIYRNEEGLIYQKNIDNMKVEACDCA